tara:strand:- start:460 stop:651 length:192 start_codon:yes stop_codon:yes gene_type:complete
VDKNGSSGWPNIDSVDMTDFDFGEDYFNPKFIVAIEALEEIASASEQANPIALIKIAKKALRG